MITIPFRLVKLGAPDKPVKVCTLRLENNRVVFSDENLTVPLEGVHRLEDVLPADLPAWMIKLLPDAPITISPLQEVTAATLEEAIDLLTETIEAAYTPSVEQPEFITARAS